MQMTLSDVARLFEVSENTVIRWVQEANLPAEEVDSRYRFDRAELLEWATLQRLKLSPEVFQKINGESIEEVSLADALRFGGIAYQVQGSDKRAVLRSVVEGLPVPESFDRNVLLQLFLARESMGTTAVGDGLALPHPRHPVVLSVPQPALRLCFLAKPLDFQAPDGKPVDTVFAIVCPTVHEHLQLLARLAIAIRDEAFHRLLRERAPTEQILSGIERVESAFLLNTGTGA